MRRFLFFVALALFCAALSAAEEPRVIAEVKALPKALSDDFQFRKTSTYFLTEHGKAVVDRRSSLSGKPTTAGPSSALNFERQYHMHGAVTRLDQRHRTGHYFTFNWRARRAADLTVRLEYRQEKLRAFVQAQEVSYHNARGGMRSDFKVVGDDYFDDGRVISWRCLLIENGQIVAENRSYLWE